MLTVKVCGNTHGIYINPVNCHACLDITKAKNYAKIDMENVNHVIIWRNDDGSFHIAQANGYSYDKGIFANCYDEEGNKVYFD